MSDPKERVRDLALKMGISIPEERLEQLAQAWDEALTEAATVRRQPTPMPTPTRFEAGWGDKR